MANRSPSLDELVASLDPPTSDHVIIDRQMIVRSEIDSGIRLLLCHEDYVSAHLLAGAAIEILGVLGAAQNKQMSLKGLIAKVEKAFGKLEAGQAKAYLALPYNFFKHSSADLNATIPVHRVYVEMSLYNSAIDYRTVFGSTTPLMNIFVAWMAARHPELIAIPHEEANKIQRALKLDCASHADAYAFGRMQVELLDRQGDG